MTGGNVSALCISPHMPSEPLWGLTCYMQLLVVGCIPLDRTCCMPLLCLTSSNMQLSVVGCSRLKMIKDKEARQNADLEAQRRQQVKPHTQLLIASVIQEFV